MKHRRKKLMNRSQMMQAVHSEDTKPEFWNEKFTNNVVRDIKTNWKLSLQGYRVATLWECSIKYDFGHNFVCQRSVKCTFLKRSAILSVNEWPWWSLR